MFNSADVNSVSITAKTVAELKKTFTVCARRCYHLVQEYNDS